MKKTKKWWKNGGIIFVLFCILSIFQGIESEIWVHVLIGTGQLGLFILFMKNFH